MINRNRISPPRPCGAVLRDGAFMRVFFAATVRVLVLVAQLAATLGAGFLALQVGLRGMLFIGPGFGLLGILAMWFSPVRRVRRIEELEQVRV